jgi:hypothetical protein
LAEWRARKASDDAMADTCDNAVSLPSSDAAERRRLIPLASRLIDNVKVITSS